MDNKKVISFLRFLGVQLNAQDVAAINAGVKANAFPGSEPPVDEPAAPPPPAEASEPSNVELLDQLISDLGGFEAFKGILLKVVEATTPPSEPEPVTAPLVNKRASTGKNRDLVIANLVANSKGALTFADLKAMDDETLAAMSSLVPQNVDFSATSVSQNSAAEGKVPPRPQFLTAKPAKTA